MTKFIYITIEKHIFYSLLLLKLGHIRWEKKLKKKSRDILKLQSWYHSYHGKELNDTNPTTLKKTVNGNSSELHLLSKGSVWLTYLWQQVGFTRIMVDYIA